MKPGTPVGIAIIILLSALTPAFSDPNPVHRPETENIKRLFLESLGKRTPDDSTLFDLQYLFSVLYENSSASYEDGPDFMRVKFRSAYCLAAIASLSDIHRALFFLDLAEYELSDPSSGKPVACGLEQEYCALCLLKLLVLYQADRLFTSAIDEYERIFHAYKACIPPAVQARLMKILNRYRHYAGEGT